MARTTIYVRDPELLRWAVAYTGASSVSEAVERALGELRRLVAERRRQALERLHGRWADEPAVEAALAELHAGWQTWHLSPGPAPAGTDAAGGPPGGI